MLDTFRKNIFSFFIILTLINSSNMYAKKGDIHERKSLYKAQNNTNKTLVLTLKNAESRLLGNNISIQLAYEKLFQARKNIVASRASFFPNGEWFAYAAASGPQGAAYVGGILIGVHLLSMPSKWFEYKANKEMAKAEKHTFAAIKRNIWGELANIYFHVLKDQMILKSIHKQCSLHKEYVDYVNYSIELGSASETMALEAKKDLLTCKMEEKKFYTLLKDEMSELKTMLQIDVNTKVSLDMQEFSPVSDRDRPRLSSGELMDAALENSHELKQLEHLKEVSVKLRKGEQLSIISFRGLGFGHSGRVAIAKSRTRMIENILKQVNLEIPNQIDASLEKLNSQIDISLLQDEELEASKQMLKESESRYKDHLDTFKELTETRIRHLKSMRSSYTSRLMVKVAQKALAREVGYSHNNGYSYNPTNPIDEYLVNKPPKIMANIKNVEDSSKKSVTLYLVGDIDDLLQVQSVTYEYSSFDKQKVLWSHDTQFSHTFTTRKKVKHVTVKIKLHNGNSWESTEKIEID